jgi:hypothetical protein
VTGKTTVELCTVAGKTTVEPMHCDRQDNS